MIREILRPNSNNLTISIPNEYINQEIEFIMFPLSSHEIVKTDYVSNKPKNITSSLFGVLKDVDINQNDYQDYLEDKYL